VGHSFGGQAFGLAPSATALASLVTVASQSGYVGHWPPASRAVLRLLWRGVMPGVSHAVGYWPGRALRTGEDLPRGVALEWARWCMSADYHGEFAAYARLRAPLLGYSVEDDWIAPIRAVDALHRAFAGCRVTRRHLTPAQFGVSRLGHFGLFREPAALPVWEEIAEWLIAPAFDGLSGDPENFLDARLRGDDFTP
jgi:predicted alpha/beta hydrolase